MLASQLAKEIGAEFIPAPDSGDPDIARIAPIAHAEKGDVTFIASEEYARYLATTRASAVILKAKVLGLGHAQLVHSNPYWAFARAAQLFFPPKRELPGVADTAFIAKSAAVHPTATVYPNAYVGERAVIGAHAVLYPGVYVGDDASVGEATVIRANVVIEHGVRIGARCLIHAGSVIGADGFGFAPGQEGHAKIPQVGSVSIGDDVEVGALCTIDRGALESTLVGDGTKLDSHVHIGHGVRVGKHCILCAFSGVAGSAKLGDRVTLGGGAAVDNRVEMATGSTLGALSGMTKDATEAGVYLGFPAIPAGEWRRQVARLRKLGDLEARLRDLEKHLGK